MKNGSIIICTASGSKTHLGKVAFIDRDYDFAFGGFMGQITPKAHLNPRYLFYVMTSQDYKLFIEKLSIGMNINNLKFSDLQSFSLEVPPLPEQKRIVAILDKIFQEIDAALPMSRRIAATVPRRLASDEAPGDMGRLSGRAVMAVTALREALCLAPSHGAGGPELPRCPITSGHMSCGSRFPPKRKHSFPILAVMPTLKLAAAPKRQPMIP